jgi:pentatricopeptide repeat protein
MQARAKGIGTISTNATGSLVDLDAKCGSIKDAWRVFNKMPSQDVVTWNAMLGGCAMHGHGKEALQHFEQMCEGAQPDDIIFICLLSVCGHAGLVDEGMCCYAPMVTDYDFCKIGTLHLHGQPS